MIEGGATVEWLREAVPALAALDVAVPDALRSDAIRALEELKGAAAAAQARMTAAFAASQRAEQAADGVPAERQIRGIPSQVGLAKRESPARAGTAHRAGDGGGGCSRPAVAAPRVQQAWSGAGGDGQPQPTLPRRARQVPGAS